MATVFYARVSTLDQTLEHQVTQARKAGYEIDEVISDVGVSGVKHRLIDSPQGRRLFDILRAGDVLVVRWLDRLGRSYEDVTSAVREFMNSGVVVKTVINGMVFDGATKDPVQQAVRDALISFLAATAQAQSEATKIAQRAGIDAAKSDPRKYAGRKPSYNRETVELVKHHLESGKGASSISKITGLSRQAIIRIRDNPDVVEASLIRWGL